MGGGFRRGGLEAKLREWLEGRAGVRTLLFVGHYTSQKALLALLGPAAPPLVGEGHGGVFVLVRAEGGWSLEASHPR